MIAAYVPGDVSINAHVYRSRVIARSSAVGLPGQRRRAAVIRSPDPAVRRRGYAGSAPGCGQAPGQRAPSRGQMPRSPPRRGFEPTRASVTATTRRPTERSVSIAEKPKTPPRPTSSSAPDRGGGVIPHPTRPSSTTPDARRRIGEGIKDEVAGGIRLDRRLRREPLAVIGIDRPEGQVAGENVVSGRRWTPASLTLPCRARMPVSSRSRGSAPGPGQRVRPRSAHATVGGAGIVQPDGATGHRGRFFRAPEE